MNLPALLLALAIAAPLAASPISPYVHGAIMCIADREGVPRSVANQLQIEESGDWQSGTWGDAHAIGKERDGGRSLGLYQLNERWLGAYLAQYWREPVSHFDVFDPIDNATVALRYLSALHRDLGTWYAALCFYNAGRVHGAPHSTRDYAARIVAAGEP